MKADNNRLGAALLLQKAEEQLKAQKLKANAVVLEAGALKMLHELEVHQIELEMQNEELLLAKEATLLASEKYTNLFDFAPFGYIVSSKKGDILELNFAAAKMLGKERIYLIGKTLALFISEDTRPIFNSFIKSLYSVEKTSVCEVIIAMEGKAEIHAHIEGACSINKEQCLLTLLDITKRKIIEEQLRESEIKLKELNASKDKFFSIIGHDLKSPFNAIVGFSNLLVEQIKRKDIEGIDEYANIILKSSNKAMDLLTNLMEWARMQTGRIVCKPEYFDMVNCINKEALLLNFIAWQKSINIKNNLPHEMTVFADKDMISTVLRNLISNAIKFTMPGGEIVISALEKQNKIIFSVSDSGVGISKNSIEKLFQIDQSYSTPDTNKNTGTGLGLILCKEFVEKNKGKIWVESDEGKGSTFFFTLPYNAEQQEKKDIEKDGSAAIVNHDNSAASGLKILIAEDDDVSEKLLEIEVKLFSKEILKAKTGLEAVEICRDNPDIDLILMDIQMAEMSGHEATRQIRKFNKKVVIIAQTAIVITGAREKALEAGCSDFIEKPIRKTELLHLIEKHFVNN